MAEAALGLVVHTGWAAAVVVTGTLAEPTVVARAEVQMLGDPERFVFHRAAEGERAEAATSIARARDEAARNAGRGIRQVLGQAASRVATCAIVAKGGPMRMSLDAILAAHPRIHSAEGSFYRDVLGEAAIACGLSVRVVPPKDVAALAAEKAGVGVEEVAMLVARAGKAAGPPWGKDQKDAALGAWGALAQTRGRAE
jgi:hypothetical protein